MSDPRHRFRTHRCALMPTGVSIRNYEDVGASFQYPAPDQWTIARVGWDSEYDYRSLDEVNPMPGEGARYCPWCGADLVGGKR